jgi:hypothetical protein
MKPFTLKLNESPLGSISEFDLYRWLIVRLVASFYSSRSHGQPLIFFFLLSLFFFPPSLFSSIMVTHQQVDAVNRFLHTTYGRERTCRLIQYFARFYAFYLTRQGASLATIERWSELKQHVGNARKFFRLLKPIEFAQSGIKALNTGDEVLRITGVLKQLGMGLYYSAEVLVLVIGKRWYQKMIY